MSRKKTQIRHDYKTPLVVPDTSRRFPRPRFVLAAAAVAVLIAVFFGIAPDDDPASARDAEAIESVALAMPATQPTGNAPTAVPANAPDQDGYVLEIPLKLPGQDQVDPGATDDAPLSAYAPPTPKPVPPPAVQAPDTKSPREDAGRAATETILAPLPVPAAPAEEQAPAAMVDSAPATELLVRRGDTLDGLFGKNGLSRSDLVTLLKTPASAEHLAMLKPGDQIFVTHEDGRVRTLTRAIDEERTLTVARNGDGFDSRIDINPVERRVTHAQGRIESSLFLAARDAGVSDKLIMNLAGLFAWDIDFVLDIREGDGFVVIYEEIWQDGELLRDGDVLAAEFSNRGEVYRAVRFVDDEGHVGHYTPEGINMRKAFIRAPIAITPRVTSNFNPRRLHPVHKKVRPHRGVDYGAPTGTPIKAAGDGKVIFRGRKGGYGNTVILQHGGNITTLYAHMSKFNRKATMGKRVKQGQVIGYVGATGTVTAQHLHYEYRVNGVHQNPRTVKLPKADPIPARYRDAFMTSAQPLLTRLDAVSRRTRLADAGG